MPTEAGEKVEGGRDEKETYRMEEVTEKGSRVIFLRCPCGRTCTLCVVYIYIYIHEDALQRKE